MYDATKGVFAGDLEREARSTPVAPVHLSVDRWTAYRITYIGKRITFSAIHCSTSMNVDMYKMDASGTHPSYIAIETRTGRRDARVSRAIFNSFTPRTKSTSTCGCFRRKIGRICLEFQDVPVHGVKKKCGHP